MSVVDMMSTEKWDDGKTMFISANPGSTNSVTVPNLSPVSSYAFRIRAENEVGKSDYSREVAVTTTIEGMWVWMHAVTRRRGEQMPFSAQLLIPWRLTVIEAPLLTRDSGHEDLSSFLSTHVSATLRP